MTPTLMGRWQTRLILLGTIGLAVTLIFGRLVDDYTTPLTLLGYVLVIGFVWDMFYDYMQTLRWDQDWPPVLQLATGIIEAAFLWGLILVGDQIGWLGGTLPRIAPSLSVGLFLTHYTLVWVTTFLATQGVLRIIFPRWRFHGGKCI